MKKITGIAWISYISIIGITICSIAVSSYNHVSALEYTTNYNNAFTLLPSISVSLSSPDLIIDDLLPNTSSDSNEIIVNVESNNSTGYVLNSSVGNNSIYASNLDNLVNTVSSNYKFTNLALDADLASIDDSEENNVWGYSYATYNTESSTWNAWSSYNGLPLYNNTNPAVLNSTLTPSAENGDNIKFKIAAKASIPQGSGEYTNIINFIAVGNPTPTSFYDAFVTAASQPGSTITQLNGYYKMQDMTADICGAVDIEEDQISLIDVRDNNVYNVAKLKDNRCWMIQNLRFSGTSLDSATSNVDSIYTTSNPLTINWLELKTDSNCYYDGSSGKGWINTCMHKPDVEDLANISSLGYTSEDIGAWYNYAGLTVGTITGASNTAKAQFSICPANWMLPTYIADSGEFSTLKNILSSDPSSFNPIYGGAMINGGYRYPTTKGTWYSSDQAGSQNSFRGGLDYSENSLNFFTASRYDGRYVRCIANNE